MGMAADLFVVRRRRCFGIDTSSLGDLTSPAPSASVIVFMTQDTSSAGVGLLACRTDQVSKLNSPGAGQDYQS